MERSGKQLLAAFLMGVLMPGLTLRLGGRTGQVQGLPADAVPTSAQTAPTQAPAQPMQLPVLMADGTVVTMELDTYLTGVVLAEMPASFEPDALKAQAVVARTYALRHYADSIKHPGGAVCTDPGCCQAYVSEEDYLADGSEASDVEKIRDAVETTSGLVLTYGGELIDATYFSCSGGRTEDALAVWGEDIPYLQSVESPGEEWAGNYSKTVWFPAEEFMQLLGRSLSGSPVSWLGVVTYTEGGGVATMVIGGKSYSGTELRRLLSLNSTAFTMTAEAGGISVTTSGKGHRVGMSQYGADAMAAAGSSWEEILLYYYQGTRIDKMDEIG